MLTSLRSNWQEIIKMKQTSHRVAPVVTDMKQEKMNWHLKFLDQIVFAAQPLQLSFGGKAEPLSEWLQRIQGHMKWNPLMPPTPVFEKMTQNTQFNKKIHEKLGSKAKLVFWQEVAKSLLKSWQYSNLTFKQQNIPGKGKHHQKKPLAFCNTAALMSALFIVGQLIQSSTSEETRLAAAAILLQCQNTKKEWYSAANQFQSAFWFGISCTLYTVCSHNAPKWPNREGPELGQIMSWGALPPLSAPPFPFNGLSSISCSTLSIICCKILQTWKAGPVQSWKKRLKDQYFSNKRAWCFVADSKAFKGQEGMLVAHFAEIMNCVWARHSRGRQNMQNDAKYEIWAEA